MACSVNEYTSKLPYADSAAEPEKCEGQCVQTDVSNDTINELRLNVALWKAMEGKSMSW